MSKCQYIEVCPAATGWCNNSESTKECLGMVMRWYRRLKEHRGDLVVSLNCLVRKEQAEEIEKKIREQVGSGVIVLPPGCTAEYVPPDVEIKFLRKDCGRSEELGDRLEGVTLVPIYPQKMTRWTNFFKTKRR